MARVRAAGVVAAITPWNIPFGIPFSVVANAVAAGNAVVLKPSELTPLTAERVPRLLAGGRRSGRARPARAGRGAGGRRSSPTPGIAKVFFTGSVAVGRRVAAAAGARGCPVVLELGGKDPLVVFADADLDRAVAGALFASFPNAGQACVAPSGSTSSGRPTTSSPSGSSQALRELKLGVEVGPLISERQRDTVERLSPAQRPARNGWFLEPTVVRGPLPDQEIFGPVVTVEPFDGEDGAVQRANDSEFGLAASVWSRDLAKADRVARRIEAGMTGSTTSATRSRPVRRHGAESRARSPPEPRALDSAP